MKLVLKITGFVSTGVCSLYNRSANEKYSLTLVVDNVQSFFLARRKVQL